MNNLASSTHSIPLSLPQISASDGSPKGVLTLCSVASLKKFGLSSPDPPIMPI